MNQNPETQLAQRPQPALLPAVDVIEDAAGITLYADLPGVPRDKLDIRVEGDQLTIEGELQLPIAEGLEGTHAEVTLPLYRRVFNLSRELDTTKVAAELRDGVLTLRIPKAEHAQPRRIEVQAA
ncbi:Hsp20/alpha crystallin family protein [Immundisolibacter sp.]|uniref:Hsp20/alpha crystallin family protein n=1 Tax=Immundisolibacter sp. TaxID=1934948 RepID=UPI00262E02A8|nr:Hsp20/alpha crystallin family protein [Immundisolibacter sp.]MDD3652294.1 Hsp20/alpha crystallin family protein [Immundisolibacter sp.]